jgi:hypothetical protein
VKTENGWMHDKKGIFNDSSEISRLPMTTAAEFFLLPLPNFGQCPFAALFGKIV